MGSWNKLSGAFVINREFFLFNYLANIAFWKGLRQHWGRLVGAGYALDDGSWYRQSASMISTPLPGFGKLFKLELDPFFLGQKVARETVTLETSNSLNLTFILL